LANKPAETERDNLYFMALENKITVNGKEYRDINDVPPEFKVLFGDKNNNGIPDFVEGILETGNKSNSNSLTANFNSFIYNGKQYPSLDSMPPEARELVQKGLDSLNKSGMKIMMPKAEQTNIPGIQTDTGKVSPSLRQEAMQNETLQNEAQQELRPGFKFRVAMTIVFFILALVYILWLLKMLPI
jgi:hypothetical protein